MQRVALREALLRRTGTVPNAGARYGPGSAAHRSARATRCAPSGARSPKNRRSRTCECIPIPVLKTSLILLTSCPVRGASRGVRKWGRAKAGRRGNPKADAAPGDVPRKHRLGRPRVSVRPLTGSATVSWLDGDRRAARKRRAQGPLRGSAKSPEERTRVLRRRGGTLRGVAVCLCFSAIREISRGCYQGAPFGVPSPLNVEGRSTKSPTRAAARERERSAV
jgi:hypothetical protein